MHSGEWKGLSPILRILVKVFCSNLLNMSPCTLHIRRQHSPTQNTFPRNRINPLAEITNLLRSEFPASSNRVRYKLLQDTCWHFQRNILRGLIDLGLITSNFTSTGADTPAKAVKVAVRSAFSYSVMYCVCVGSMLVFVIVWLNKGPPFVAVHFVVSVVVPVDARFVAVPVVSVIMSWCSHKLRVVRTCV